MLGGRESHWFFGAILEFLQREIFLWALLFLGRPVVPAKQGGVF